MRASPTAPTGPAQTDETIDPGASVACGNATYTRDNKWFRVFDLSALGVTGPLTVTQVSFGVQTSNAAQTIAVAVGTFDGTATDTLTGTPTFLANASVPVGVVATPTMMTTPLAATIPAGSKLIVTVQAPDYSAGTTKFYLGTTAAAEIAPGYILAPACNIATPTSLRTVNAAAGAAIITVTGSY